MTCDAPQEPNIRTWGFHHENLALRVYGIRLLAQTTRCEVYTDWSLKGDARTLMENMVQRRAEAMKLSQTERNLTALFHKHHCHTGQPFYPWEIPSIDNISMESIMRMIRETRRECARCVAGSKYLNDKWGLQNNYYWVPIKNLTYTYRHGIGQIIDPLKRKEWYGSILINYTGHSANTEDIPARRILRDPALPRLSDTPTTSTVLRNPQWVKIDIGPEVAKNETYNVVLRDPDTDRHEA